MTPKTTETYEITVILLAAGASSRMKNTDKLLEKIEGTPLLARVALSCLASNATNYIAVVRPGDSARQNLLPAPFRVLENPDWGEGMAASLRLGLANTNADCDGSLVVLGDMPDIGAADINALISAYCPETGHTICRATTEDGQPGHPVLIGRNHFEALNKITGDQGARQILTTNPDAIRLVKTRGQSAAIDLDTPSDWAAYNKR